MRLQIGILTLALMLKADSVWACATCFGAEGDPQTEGLNAAIITLLSVTYALFTGMALLAFFYWKRNRVLCVEPIGDGEAAPLEEAPTTHD